MAEKKTTNFTTPILAVLLTIVSFLLGSIWTKNKYLTEAVQKEEGRAAQTSPAPRPKEKTNLSEEERVKIEKQGAAIKGKEGAPITIVEFSEYQCPFCKRYVDETYGKLWQEYGDQLRYVFHDYPLNFHSHAQKLAEVARCAGDQGQYWEMHDLLFKKREEWVNKRDISANITSYVKQLGLNQADFDRCLSSGKFTQTVKDDFALGQSLGVNGTPTFFINGKKLVGAQPFENFKAIIDQELAQ